MSDLLSRYLAMVGAVHNMYTCGEIDEGIAFATAHIDGIGVDIERAIRVAEAADSIAALECWPWIASHLNCSEADTFAEFLRTLDMPSSAEEFLESHGEGDDDKSDLHINYKAKDVA